MVYFQSLTKNELAEMLLPLSRVKEERELRDHPERAEELGPKIEKKKVKQAELRAKQIFHWAYQRYVLDFDQMSDLAKDVREFLKQNLTMFRLQESYAKQSEDGTYKFLWKLDDNKTIESVIIPAALKEKARDEILQEEIGIAKRATAVPAGRQFTGAKVSEADLEDSWERLTACVSSQVGCAMACKFCLTGVQGLDRSLGVHEVVTQIHELRMRAPITNIVFMGMGEPLHNVTNIAKACQILLDEDGMNFSKRKVTVSTSGLVPGIEELYSKTDVSLAISLNASSDEQRSQIMPVNKKWPISVLLDACRAVNLGPHRRITFEYVLLKDFNDTTEDAHRVAKLLRGIPAKVNIIPFNEHSGSDFKRPDDATVMAFQKILIQAGYTATVRISRGRDILAACGQLRSLFGTARGTEKHRDYQAAGAVAPQALDAPTIQS